jgi:hypothetical protein
MFHLGFHKNATSFVSNWFMGFPPFFIKWLKGGQTGRGSREREREREKEREGGGDSERERERRRGRSSQEGSSYKGSKD